MKKANKMKKSKTVYSDCLEYMNRLLNTENSCIGTLLYSCPTLLKYDDIILSKTYEHFESLKYYTTVHNGQLKLMLSEIQFLTNNLKSVNDEAYVIYAGSAPGNKNVHLSTLFPNVKFIFVDPEEHFFMMGEKNQYTSNEIMNKIMYLSLSKIRTKFSFRQYIKGAHNVKMYNPSTKNVEKVDRNNPRFSTRIFNYASMIRKHDYPIYVIENFFTSELSKDLAKLKDDGIPLFFISDIRTVSPYSEKRDSDDEGPINGDILWNSAQMYNWVSILKPDMFMLKFRCPFSYEENVDKFIDNEDIREAKERGIDFVENYKNKKYVFIKSKDIFLQAYQGSTSTESRLIGKYPFELQTYDIKEYEDKFFYYNRYVRSFGYNDSIPDQFLDKYHMIDRCTDCGIAYHILSSYIKKKNMGMDDPVKAHNLLSDILKNLKREMLNTNIDSHGLYYERLKDEKTLIAYNSLMCDIKNGVHFHNITRVSQPSEKTMSQYIKNIVETEYEDDPERHNGILEMRDACMMHYLFGINTDGLIDFNVEISKDYEATEEKLSKAFSQIFCHVNPLTIRNKLFYKRFEEFHSSHHIKNVVIFRSTKYDPFFYEEFYSKYTIPEDVHDLILSGGYLRNYKKLTERVTEDTFIIVCLEERDSVFFHLRKYFISVFKNNKILFMKRSNRGQIFDPYNYLCEYDNYQKIMIHIETYNPYSAKEKVLAKDFSFDPQLIDQNIGFKIQDVPYLFLDVNIENIYQNYYDVINHVRVYIITEDLSNNDEFKSYLFYRTYAINKIANSGCTGEKMITNYFLFTNDISEYSSIQIFKNLRLNGKQFKPEIKNMEDVIHFDKINLDPSRIYSFLNISEKKFKNVNEILKSIK
jgi:hypothetical protein